MFFEYRGSPVRVDIYSTGGKHATYYTQLHIRWPDNSLRCEVRPERVASRVGKFFGMEDILIGSPTFDDRYLIQGNDKPAIRMLLSSDVCAQIELLRGFLDIDDIYFSVVSGRMLIKKRPLIRDEATLERFIRMSLELFDRAMITNTTGIDFVESDTQDAELILAAAICQVCGDEIKAQVVLCRSCKTPHHQDCWQYYGSCSTYGCGQTKFLVQRSSRSGGVAGG